MNYGRKQGTGKRVETIHLYILLDVVNQVFQGNLFDDVDLTPTFRVMLGLTEHTPFECIGETEHYIPNWIFEALKEHL
jgi:hypothetical protein